eukprot:IDg2038t1
MHFNKADTGGSTFSMTYVERYHKPLRRAYEIISKEVLNIDRESALQYAVKAINDSVGPDGLVPTLLVCGALPRLGLPTDKPAAGTFERAIAVRKASEQMSRHFAQRQVRDALNTPNGPNVQSIHEAPLGSHVLVYRIKKDKWEGPFSLLHIDGETCTVLCPDGQKTFRTTVVKPYKYPQENQGNNPGSEFIDSNLNNRNSTTDQQNATAHLTIIANCLMTDLPSIHYTSIKDMKRVFSLLRENRSIGGSRFENSRNKEIRGLLEMDEIKNEGTKDEYEKSRLVVQGYNDRYHGFLTQAPTVQRSSQRMLFGLAMLLPSWSIVLRDIIQAYTQSKTQLKRL